MFCEKCGNKIHDGERFCSECGARVEEYSSPSDIGSFSEQQHTQRPAYDDREKKTEPEYNPDLTAGMGYGYRQTGNQNGSYRQPEERWAGERQTERKKPVRQEEDAFEEEWEKEERKEKITFIILGVIIVLLVAAIVAGVIFLVKSGEDRESERTPQLNEEMKEELEQSRKDPEVTEEPTPEPTQEPTAEPTQEATPVPTQEITPEPTQEATPEPTQEVTPVPTQEVTPAPTQAPAVSDTSGDYIIADSSTRYLTNADLSPLSEWEVRIARNEIYARHGRIFNTKELADYFAGKSWYTPSISPENFNNSYLNSIEIENLKFITNYEKAHNLNQ